MVLGCTLGVFGFWYYEAQDEEAQKRIQEFALDGIDWVRETRGMPEFGVDLFDVLYDAIPASVGPVTPLNGYQEDSFYAFAGHPAGDYVSLELENKGYLVGYDEKMQNPAWVAYRLFERKEHPIGARPSSFTADKRTRARVPSTSYARSGYDRGHMAPNFGIAYCYGRDAQLETFLMSNISPQHPDLNRKIWKELEHRVAKRYTKRFEEVWVITGPIYYKRTHVKRIQGKAAIPDAFFKIIIDEHPEGLRTLAFIIPQSVNGDEPLRPFLVSIDTIESLTHIDFLVALPEDLQQAIESQPNVRVW